MGTVIGRSVVGCGSVVMAYTTDTRGAMNLLWLVCTSWCTATSGSVVTSGVLSSCGVFVLVQSILDLVYDSRHLELLFIWFVKCD